MKKISKVLKAGILAAFVAVIIAAPSFADASACFSESGKYPELSLSGGTGSEYPVKCAAKYDGQTVYGKTSAACAQLGSASINPDDCEKTEDLNEVIKRIVNTIIFVIGIVAVVMIILGGINYATSQGDPSKVKKGKDTILYGIIGLVVALLAFAIVNFVLGALNS